MKIPPAHGDGGSSIKLVLQINEIPPAHGHGGSSTTNQRESSRLTGTAVPVLSLYYKSTKIQPAHGDGVSSTKLVLSVFGSKA